MYLQSWIEQHLRTGQRTRQYQQFRPEHGLFKTLVWPPFAKTFFQQIWLHNSWEAKNSHTIRPSKLWSFNAANVSCRYDSTPSSTLSCLKAIMRHVIVILWGRWCLLCKMGQLRPRLCPNAVSIQWAWKGCPHCVIAQSSPSLALSKQIGQQTDATMGNLYS